MITIVNTYPYKDKKHDVILLNILTCFYSFYMHHIITIFIQFQTCIRFITRMFIKTFKLFFFSFEVV